MKIILASASPRRKELLSLITEEFTVLPSGVVEEIPKKFSPEKQVEYLAKIKALDIAQKMPDDLIIGADTGVFLHNRLFGKPKSIEDAENMLKSLSGRTHKVITGCAIVKNGLCKSFSVTSKVKFFKLCDAQIKDYINTSEPYDKAGSYAIQGKGSLFVEKISGDYFNIVGLPISELNKYLKQYI